jgi:hypothetical protein
VLIIHRNIYTTVKITGDISEFFYFLPQNELRDQYSSMGMKRMT